MTKTYPNYENPTMIYNTDNEYTIVDATHLKAALAEGWRQTHSASIHEPLKEYGGVVAFEVESNDEAEANPAIVTLPVKKKKT